MQIIVICDVMRKCETQNLFRSILLLVCVSTTAVACQTSNTRNADSDAVHKRGRATLDGDITLFDDDKDFYSRIRASSLNGQELHVYPSGEVRGERFTCKHRRCNLYLGQHTINVEYVWSSLAAEKKHRKKDGSQSFANFLLIFAGGAAGTPDSSRYYPCQAVLTFDAQAKHDYALNALHRNHNEEPEEIQIVDTPTGAVVSRANPACDEYFIPAAAPEG